MWKVRLTDYEPVCSVYKHSIKIITHFSVIQFPWPAQSDLQEQNTQFKNSTVYNVCWKKKITLIHSATWKSTLQNKQLKMRKTQLGKQQQQLKQTQKRCQMEMGQKAFWKTKDFSWGLKAERVAFRLAMSTQEPVNAFRQYPHWLLSLSLVHSIILKNHAIYWHNMEWIHMKMVTPKIVYIWNSFHLGSYRQMDRNKHREKKWWS